MCTATGNPPPKYKWIAPTGKELVTWGNIHIKDGNMTFRKVEPNLRGIYTCKAYNVIEKTGEKIGEVEAKVEVVDVYGKVYWILCVSEALIHSPFVA